MFLAVFPLNGIHTIDLNSDEVQFKYNCLTQGHEDLLLFPSQSFIAFVLVFT